MEITKIETKTDGKVIISKGKCNNDYEIISRIWIRSDGKPIREWTPDEYVKWNPNNKKIIKTTLDGCNVEMVAYCSELQRYYAYNKQGDLITSIDKIVKYNF